MLLLLLLLLLLNTRSHDGIPPLPTLGSAPLLRRSSLPP
jgi:hypothetical protein